VHADIEENVADCLKFLGGKSAGEVIEDEGLKMKFITSNSCFLVKDFTDEIEVDGININTQDDVSYSLYTLAEANDMDSLYSILGYETLDLLVSKRYLLVFPITSGVTMKTGYKIVSKKDCIGILPIEFIKKMWKEELL